MTQWWSESLMREFSQRADCFIQQYAAFTIDHIDKPVSVLLYSIRILINRSYSSLSSEIAPAILIYVDEFAQVGKRRVEVTE